MGRFKISGRISDAYDRVSTPSTLTSPYLGTIGSSHCTDIAMPSHHSEDSGLLAHLHLLASSTRHRLEVVSSLILASLIWRSPIIPASENRGNHFSVFQSTYVRLIQMSKEDNLRTRIFKGKGVWNGGAPYPVKY